MNAMLRTLIGMAVVAAVGASGCVYKPIQIGGPLFGSEALKGKRLSRIAEGKACSAHILYAIPVGDDSMGAALEKMTGKGGWTADIVTVEQGEVFWLLGWSNCTRIVGYVAAAPAKKFKTTAVAPTPADGEAEPAPEPAAAAPAP